MGVYGDQRERMNFKLMCEVGNIPASDAPWMHIMHIDIPDHIIDEYNAWHDKEHLPRCAGIPGVLRARRFTSTGILDGTTGAQDTVNLKMRPLFNNTRRALYNLVTPTPPMNRRLRNNGFLSHDNLGSLLRNARQRICRMFVPPGLTG